MRMASTIRHNRARGKHGTTSFTSRNVKIRLGRNQDYEELGMTLEEVNNLGSVTSLQSFLLMIDTFCSFDWKRG
jgi:hypothetical protein